MKRYDRSEGIQAIIELGRDIGWYMINESVAGEVWDRMGRYQRACLTMAHHVRCGGFEPQPVLGGEG